MNFRKLCPLAAGLGLLAGPVLAGAADNSLTIGMGEELPSFDGYISTSRDGVVMTRHLFDMLIYRNPETFEFEPLLATEWSRVDDLTWEFKLREGVTFHDGSEFNADDVVWTLNHYADPESGARSQASVSWIDKVEAVDPMIVRIVSKEPFPAALEFVSGSLPIYPSDYVESVGLQEFGQAPIGTGPYKFTPGDSNSYTLTAYEGYYEGGGKGTPAIGTLTFRIIPDTATRIAELIGGGVEWIWNVPADQVAQLGTLPHLQAELGSTMRIAMIGMDAAGRANPDTPFKDERVRRAVNHAIDRDTIVANLVGGDGEVIDVPCYPAQFGCVTEAATTYEYDPEKAKALLAEAGYGEGFKVRMNSYRDRARAEAVQSYLAAVGIEADLEMLQARASFSAWREGNVDIWYGDWGSFSIGDASASTGNFFDGSTNDGARDEEIIGLVQQAATTVDEAEREALYSDVIGKITERAYWVPMHTIVMGYGYADGLNFTPNVDELPRFFLASWE
ncbi:ABC transporter substrate-binding protein [Tropicimonas aquimaris]|uniref:ABC transporter substrate-binding protein n=1 Tax=Tropicimonas aquimaris TaxID=914152 RepID=A0ABW3ILW9_9RHOB